ncbi:MAG: hypothetical protein QOF57_1052 [Frankiaceae bacterium]|jgi:hypothetical protein|nr:hypothetical protein [Frankiaceae bacterium]
MPDRVLRGSRLGATSYETERTNDLAPRQVVIYDCPRGHEVHVPMAEEAEVPSTWECKVCGAVALQRDTEQPEARRTKPVRTHWDMLLERRSLTELEVILTERLEELHRSRVVPKSRKSA